MSQKPRCVSLSVAAGERLGVHSHPYGEYNDPVLKGKEDDAVNDRNDMSSKIHRSPVRPNLNKDKATEPPWV
jgi:hypothetical protein